MHRNSGSELLLWFYCFFISMSKITYISFRFCSISGTMTIKEFWLVIYFFITSKQETKKNKLLLYILHSLTILDIRPNLKRRYYNKIRLTINLRVLAWAFSFHRNMVQNLVSWACGRSLYIQIPPVQEYYNPLWKWPTVKEERKKKGEPLCKSSWPLNLFSGERPVRTNVGIFGQMKGIWQE